MKLWSTRSRDTLLNIPLTFVMAMHHNHVRLDSNWNVGLCWYTSEHVWSHILCTGHEGNCIFGFHVIHNV